MDVNPTITVYPVTPSLIEWLAHTFVPIDEAAFHYWRDRLPLLKMCRDAENGHIAMRPARAQVRKYNEQNKTSLTYEEIVGLEDYQLYEAGEWAFFVSDKEDQLKILTGDWDNPHDAFINANPDISWGILYLPTQEYALVYRSPHKAYREESELEADISICEGMCRGSLYAYTLPPEIEGSIRQDIC